MNSSKGFTLVELSVAFVIIVLLLAGAMIPLSTQIDLRSVSDTQRSMESIREAVIGFAQANGRLPCPANGATASGAAGAGTEQFNAGSGLCTAVAGVVPWATLGVPETDAWGRRFTYRVSPPFADALTLTTWNTRLSGYTAPPGNIDQVVSSPVVPADQNPPCHLPLVPTFSSFALCTLGDIAVFSRGPANTTAVPLGTALAAVILSHGKNGFGGRQPNGTQLTPIPAAGTDEGRNLTGNTPATPAGGYSSRAFYSRSRTPAAAGCVDPAPGSTNTAPACEFDDIVVMITPQALVTRMVAAGRLP